MTRHRRHSIRLSGYDYTQEGAYFITICTHRRQLLFGEVGDDGRMGLNAVGALVEHCWLSLAARYKCIQIDTYQIMPNHLHGIIRIVGAGFMSAPESAGVEFGADTRPAPTIGDIICAFKSSVIHALVDKVKHEDWSRFASPLWQRNYYEHIIREGEIDRYREYIAANPQRWLFDPENPRRIRDEDFAAWTVNSLS